MTKSGRPAIGPQVKLRIPAETRDQVRVFADAQGVTASEWMRQAIQDRLDASQHLRPEVQAITSRFAPDAPLLTPAQLRQMGALQRDAREDGDLARMHAYYLRLAQDLISQAGWWGARMAARQAIPSEYGWEQALLYPDAGLDKGYMSDAVEGAFDAIDAELARPGGLSRDAYEFLTHDWVRAQVVGRPDFDEAS